MTGKFQWHSLKEGHAKRAPLARGIAWGLIGGLAGTMVMDSLLMGALLALKLPLLVLNGVTALLLVRVLRHDAGLAPEAARAAIGPRTRAIVPVHLYGLPADEVVEERADRLR